MSNSNLSQRLRVELGTREPAQVIDLNLDNTKSNEIEGLTDEYINLSNLSLVNVGLLTLNRLPTLPSLKKIDLSDNKLGDGLEILVTNAPILEKLSLSGNKFKDLTSIQPLSGLLHLRSLDLYNCPVANYGNFRKELFIQLANLIFLDGFDRDNEEEPEDDEFDDEEEEDYEEGLEDDEDDEEEEEEEDDDEDSSVEEDGTNGKEIVNGVNKVTVKVNEEEEDDEDYEEFDEEEEEAYEFFDDDAVLEAEDVEDQQQSADGNVLKRKRNPHDASVLPTEDAPQTKVNHLGDDDDDNN